jgi:hypothetical protein
VFVPHAVAAGAWDEVQRLRAAGECVVPGLPGEMPPSRCDRELRPSASGGWELKTLE